ncbi:hypothetical protein EON64_16050 [archaeon]|nr:MAG: hypothetical protein EON64_16050 [archaeon]
MPALYVMCVPCLDPSSPSNEFVFVMDGERYPALVSKREGSIYNHLLYNALSATYGFYMCS